MSINFKSVIKGSVFSVLITMFIILILALLSYFTGISENVVSICVYASVIIGVLMGAIAVSRAVSGKVFIHAMLVCVMYLAVLVGISAIFNKGITVNSHLFAITGGIFASGFLGSVIGK
ncbi:MAG: TIGR04086 family membrane protein [Oscillospiraceae bacterium]|nr:TIGR04086 family membrane protein [Oscillospiraceae bacterium]